MGGGKASPLTKSLIFVAPYSNALGGRNSFVLNLLADFDITHPHSFPEKKYPHCAGG